MRNRPILSPTVLRPALIAAGCLVLAAPAAAQQARPTAMPGGQTAGLRYLTWSGKIERSAPPAAQDVASDGLRRPGAIIPRRSVTPLTQPSPTQPSASGARPSRYGVGQSSGLTPASAWLGAASRSSSLPAPAYETAPAEPAPASPPVRPAPQPVMAAADGATPVADPMAPRRDAPIFRLRPQGPPAPATAQAEAPAQAPLQPQAPMARASGEPVREGPRYYSVHRAAGHHPDPTVIPEAVYLDTAPIDLAEPPPTPIASRIVNGRAQVIVPNEDPSLP